MATVKLKESCIEYYFDQDDKLEKIRNAPELNEIIKNRKKKTNETSIEILRCEIGSGDFRTSNVIVPVRLQYHEIGAERFIVVSANSTPLIKCNVTKSAEKIDLPLKVLTQKYLEADIKHSNAALRKEQISVAGKRKRRKIVINPTRIQHKYKELECTEAILSYAFTGNWMISFSINLNYVPNSTNNFSSETNELLDSLFSARDRSHFVKHEITHYYVQRQFNHQTSKYTKELAIPSVEGMKRPDLNLELLPFQKESVQWMLTKEGVVRGNLDFEGILDLQNVREILNKYISFGYEVMRLSSETLFWNKFTGIILTEREARKICQQLKHKEAHAKGVLSEEMGLGKTIEILALVLLNKRVLSGDVTYLSEANKLITKVATNLIICPDSILRQWVDEIYAHAKESSIMVFHYKGFQAVKKFFDTDNIREIVESLAKFDIIICSYTTVSAEVHYAEFNASSRHRRGTAPKYDYSSPLSLMQFFRIILDEVQMLKGESTNAARCTSLLHRVHTWGVSGTPIYSITDFKTVLSYLQFHPFQDFPKIVDTVRKNITKQVKSNLGDLTNDLSSSSLVNGIKFDANDLMDIFPRFDLCIRHSKADVTDQIRIPPQHNYIVPLEFLPIEQDNYMNLWSSFLEASGFGREGQGQTYLAAKELNYWLSILRKTCCHALMPKASSKQEGEQDFIAVQTIDAILKTLTDEIYDKIDGLHRENFTLRIQSAQVAMELENKPATAVEILNKTKDELSNDLKNKFNIQDPFKMVRADIEGDKDDPQVPRAKLYLDLLHQCYFFVATAYYFLGSKKLELVDEMNEKMALKEIEHKPKAFTDVYTENQMREIEKYQNLEQENYAAAESLRKEILSDRIEKVNMEILAVKNAFSKTENPDVNCVLKKIDDLQDQDYSNNMNVAMCFKQLNSLFNNLNIQADQFNDLLEKLRSLAYKPIIREYDEENQDEKALEYENSINDQDKIFAILDCLSRILDNREEVAIADEEIKISPNLFKNTQTFSDYHIGLVSDLCLVEGLPLRQVFTELKNVSIVKSLTSSSEAKEEGFEQYLLGFEREIPRVKKENKRFRDLLKKYNDIYNAKTAYFSYLQKISDSLVSLVQLEPHARSTILRNTKDDNQFHKNTKKINNLQSRIKYLETLTKLKENIDHKKRFNCTICFSEIYMGSIIKCGHFFCKSCIHSWLKTKMACPLCKMETTFSDVYTFKFQDEQNSASDEEGNDQQSKKNSNQVASDEMHVEDDLFLRKYQRYPHLEKIHQLAIKESYGTKIDFVVKLILYLKINHQEGDNDEPHSKPPQIIIYSQYADFLEILSKVLNHHSIKHVNATTSGKISTAIEKYKKNPDITCLLLNVRKQATGLTLVNATHVFILDPIINSGDEAQAINRIHRIGQTHDTYVWNFVVRNTVEQNILKYKCVLDEKKAQSRKNKNKVETSDNTQSSPSDDSDSDDDEYEFNNVGDESVSKKHIWNCFFQQ